MKNLIKKIIGFVAILSISVAAFAQSSAQITSNSKSLVVYYSLTETTAKLAERIANETGASLFRLETKKPYSKGMTTADKESKEDIKNGVHRELVKVPDLSNYDTIFVGTPVWSSDMANPVETWLLQADLKGKTVIPFCTYWGTGNEITLQHIKVLAEERGAKTKNGLSQIHGETADVKSFVKGL